MSVATKVQSLLPPKRISINDAHGQLCCSVSVLGGRQRVHCPSCLPAPAKLFVVAAAADVIERTGSRPARTVWLQCQLWLDCGIHVASMCDAMHGKCHGQFNRLSKPSRIDDNLLRACRCCMLVNLGEQQMPHHLSNVSPAVRGLQLLYHSCEKW